MPVEAQCVPFQPLHVAPAVLEDRAMDTDMGAGMDSLQLIQKLVASFNAVATELQTLADRKTILEHKLRFAHEQYQALADKYAPCAPDVAETIAKLQVPPTPTSASSVPLPSRLGCDSSQAQLALFIREGKRVARQLQALADDASKGAASSLDASTRMASDLSTVLEKDFTVAGRKGHLQCPFSAAGKHPSTHGASPSPPIPHAEGDPICAAMLEDTSPAAAANGSAAKCPIRYLDKHSPEEIARYVEKHKHELPRSHEVCLRRNQRNEEQIRKLDAKYGNLVSMISDLSHLHAPMLPESGHGGLAEDEEHSSDRRVSDWAHNVMANGDTADGSPAAEHDTDAAVEDQDPERMSHFDRPLKEIRVGESPSRPWGISVPFPLSDQPVERPSSPAAPVRMPSPAPADTPRAPAPQPTGRPSKCPFDHTKLQLNGPGLSQFPKMEEPTVSPKPAPEKQQQPAPSKQCPFSAAAAAATATPEPQAPHPAMRFPSPMNHPQPAPPDSPPPSHQPTFVNLPIGGITSHTKGDATATATTTAAPSAVPQMVFNGPVFIGYNVEQAIQFMQFFQGQQHQQHQQHPS
ncbi:hypothetical protein BD289DRAFT_440125 [Coniella lustricola]|uniref:Uncharacterized protein n=1 Tax=Coniella lustricola TaxID=2025994 RepID=A0A2T3A0X5_9PEZI|nr:hypothetical protein BD289DRAFT_440125 [Coniella lustricola]